MRGNFAKAKKYEKDMGMLISLLTEKEEAELSTLDKGSLLYQLEAEEIDLKKLGDKSCMWCE